MANYYSLYVTHNSADSVCEPPPKLVCRYLSEADLNEIKHGQKLTDRHIDAANHLLQKQFTDIRGLQTPLLGQGLHFKTVKAPFVQILFIRDGHWCTVTALDNKNVHVFDSSYRHVDDSTIIQTASILRTTANAISFHQNNVPLQDGTADCGLFAIAFAIEYCQGNEPAKFRYVLSKKSIVVVNV